jgi:acetyltransferase-like isoleucine patch superfamily enzyme
LEKLHLNIGSHSSLAHETAFLAKTLSRNKYELDVTIAEDSFIGINANIGSGAKIGARTTV